MSEQTTHLNTKRNPVSTLFELQQLDGPLGAEIRGIDLSQPLSDALQDDIWRAFLEHGLLWFPNQKLSPGQQASFAENFGDLDAYPFITPVAEHDKVIPIIKEADTKINFGGGWHTDTSYSAKPPKITMLQAVEVPDRGGDTLFADMAGAFADLSDGMQAMLSSLTGIYTADLVHGKDGAYSKDADHPMDYGDKNGIAERRVEHPVIRTHPETGRKSIYAGLAHCSHFKGMKKDESQFILQWLNEHATKAEYVTRLKWQSASLAMWDNRRVFHYALNDYAGQRRHMHRITLQGDKPV